MLNKLLTTPPPPAPRFALSRVDDVYARPSTHLAGVDALPTPWQADDFDDVMRRTGVGDGQAVLAQARANHPDAEALAHRQLMEAAQEVASPMFEGYEWSARSLESWLANPERSLAPVRTTDLEIKSIDQMLGNGISGVVREVDTSEGPAVVKLYTNSSMSWQRLKTNIAIQQYLAMHGWAPRVLRVITASEIPEALPPPYNRGGDRGYRLAVVMEKVERAPSDVSRELAGVQARHIQEWLSQKGIEPRDFSYMVDPQGRPKIIDTDLYQVSPALQA